MELKDRITKLESSYDALKVVRPMTLTVIGIFLAALVFVLTFMSAQLNGLGARIDGISARTDARIESLASKMDEGFRTLRTDMAAEARANRAEMSAQTSAIANSITATRQAAPQVLLVPAPVTQAPSADK